MKFLIIALCVVAASAVPAGRGVQQASATAEVRAAVRSGPAPAAAFDSEATAAIVDSEFEQTPEGNYRSGFKTENGIAVQNEGELKKFEDTLALVMRGQYSYPGAEGKPIVVTWTADENGFQAQSDVIPVAPELPEAIARSLVYIQEHPSKEEEYVKRA